MNPIRSAHQHAVRVLVVDDQAPFRRVMKQLVELTEGFDFVDAVADAESALEAARRTCPHLVFVDVRMPGVPGPELALRLRAEHPDLAVVLCSSCAPEDVPLDLVEHGFLFARKEDLTPELLQATWERLGDGTS